MAKKQPNVNPEEGKKNLLGDKYDALNGFIQEYEATDPRLRGEFSAQSGVQNRYNVDYNKFQGNFGYEDPNRRPQVQMGEDFLTEVVAQNQGTWNKTWKAPVRILGKAATEALKIPGYLGGLAGWASTGFDSKQFGDYLDNAWTQAFSDLDESIKESLPVYRTKAAQEAGVWSQLTDSGFWATEGADGVGFLLSMLVPGAALKGIGLGAKSAKLFSAGTKFAGKVDDFGSVVINTAVEAGAEGVEVYNKVYNDLIQRGYTENDAKQRAGEAASNTFYTNAILLAVPNYLTEKWLFRGFTDGRKLAKELLNESGELITKEARKSVLRRIGNVGASLGKGILSEGVFEEGMQYATSKYFEDQVSGKEEQFSDNPFLGILESYVDSWDELDFQKSVMLGSLLGGGMSAFGEHQENKAKQELLNGRSAYKPGRIARMFKKEKQASAGLRSVLEENYIKKYGGLHDILNPDGTVNQAKQEAWVIEQVKSGTVEAAMHLAALQGDQVSYEFLKQFTDFNFMLPYLKVEGGIDVLKGHINKIAESEALAREATFGKKQSVEEVKSELLLKAEKFQEIYEKIADKHPLSVANELGDSDFSETIFNAKLQEEIRLDYLEKQYNTINSEMVSLQSNKDLKFYPDSPERYDVLHKQRSQIEDIRDQSLEVLKNLNNKSWIKNKFEEYKAEQNTVEETLNQDAAEQFINDGAVIKDSDKNEWIIKASKDGSKFSLVSAKNPSEFHPTLKGLSKVNLYKELKENKFSIKKSKDSKVPDDKKADSKKKEVPVESETELKVKNFTKAINDSFDSNEIIEIMNKVYSEFGRPNEEDISSWQLTKTVDLEFLSSSLILRDVAAKRFQQLRKMKEEQVATLKKASSERLKTITELDESILNLEIELEQITSDVNFSKEVIELEPNKKKKINQQARKVVKDLSVKIPVLESALEERKQLRASIEEELSYINDLIDEISSDDRIVKLFDRGIKIPSIENNKRREELKELELNKHRFSKERLQTHLFYTDLEIEALSEKLEELKSLLTNLQNLVDLTDSELFDKWYYESKIADIKENLKNLKSKKVRLQKAIEVFEKIDTYKNEISDTSKRIQFFADILNGSDTFKSLREIASIETWEAKSRGIKAKNTRTKFDPNSDPQKGEPSLEEVTNKRRTPDNLFNGLATSQDDSRPRNLRYYSFLQNVNVDNNTYQVEFVTNSGTYGTLGDTKDLEIEAQYKAAHGEKGTTIWAVVVDKSGNPVDENGNVIKAEEVSQKGIFAPLGIRPTGEYGARSFGSKSEIDNAVKKNDAYRIQILSDLSEGKKVFRNIEGKSTGIPKYSAKNESDEIIPVSLKMSTGSDSIEDFEFWGSTDGNVYFSDGKQRSGRLGFFYTYHKPTGNVYALKAQQLSQNKIDIVVNLLRKYVNGLQVKDGRIVPESQTSATKIVETGKTVFSHINEIIRWTGTNKSKSGKELESRDHRRFHFAKLPGSPVTAINAGGQIFSLGTIKGNKVEFNEDLALYLKEVFLPKQYHNMITSLSNKTDDYIELTSVDKNGNVEFKTHSVEAGGYNSYLMSFAGTRVIPRNAESTQFMNRYLILENLGKTVAKEQPVKSTAPSLEEINSALKSASKQSVDSDMPDAYDAPYYIEDTSGFVSADDLFSKKPVTPKPEIKPETPSDVDGFEEDAFKLATDVFNGSENLAEVDAWLKRVLPNVPLTLVSQLIDGKAWGKFTSAGIFLYTNAEQGTLYHEAFHAVFRMYLGTQESQSLIDKYKAQHNSSLSDIEVEEIFAEKFKDFMLGVNNSTKGLPTEMKSWFQKILDLIKSLFNFYTSENVNEELNTLFNKINSGHFATLPIVNDKYNGTMYSTIGNNTTAAFTQEAISSVDYYFFAEFAKRQYKFEDLYSKDFPVEEIYSVVKSNIAAKREQISKALEAAPDNQKYKTALAGLDIVLANFENSSKHSVKALHLLALKKQYSAEAKNFDEISQDDNKESKDSTQLFAVESLKISAKNSASRSVRFAVGTLPQLTDEGKLALNSMGMPYTAEFGKMFNIMVNKFSNLRTTEEFLVAMKPLVEKYPSIKRLFHSVKINVENYNNLTLGEMNAVYQFMQAFSKNKNSFNISTISKDGYNRVDVTSRTQKLKILSNWKTKAVNYNIKDGKLVYKNPSDISVNHKSISGLVKELHKVGITFSTLNYNNLTDVEIDKAIAFVQSSDPTFNVASFRNSAMYILRSLATKESLSPFEEEVSGSGNYENMATMIKFEAATSYDFVENQHLNIDGERVYDNTLFNYLTFVTADINNSSNIEELYQKLPHLNTSYSRHSKIIESLYKNGKRVPTKKINFTILDGLREQESGEGNSFADLKTADKWIYTLNEGLNGNYVFLRASDNAVERSFNLGKPLYSIAEIAQSAYYKDILDYVKDELAFASDPRIKQYDQLNKASNHTGIILDMIKIHNPNLFKKLSEDSSTFEEDKADLVEQNKEEIIQAIETWVSSKVEATKQSLINYNIIGQLSGSMYANWGIDLNYLDKTASETQLNLVLKAYVVNNMAITVEQTKLFTGHPQAYKNADNFFKRMSGLTGTKKVVFSDNKLNAYINTHLKRSDNKVHPLGPEANNATLRTAVFADVKTSMPKEYIESYAKSIGKDRAEMYTEINEADAQGYITLDEYRELLFRSGDWNIKLEAAYLKEMGFDSFPNETMYGELAGQPLKDYLKDSKGNRIVFNPLKPQHFGPMADDQDLFVPGFYKLSVIPLVPSLMTDTKGNFRALNKLRYWMQKNQVGIAVYESGNKVGTKLNNNSIQPLYKKGAVDLSDAIYQETYYKYWGIQLETGNKTKTEVVSGTQMLKHVINSAYESGVAKPMRFITDYVKGTYSESSKEETEKRVQEYIRLSAQRIELGKQKLIEDLGLTKTDSGYKIDSTKIDKLIQTLKDEALSRDLPDNIIDGIEMLRHSVVGVDILPNSDKIENILASIADSRTISKKRHGGAKIQGAGALFEIKSTREYNDGVLSSNDLKFYLNEEGKVSQMEVYLPHYFKEIFGDIDINTLDSELLENIIGFRIPTQGLNSIESIKIKGFLPQTAGELIIMPSAITVKAGSDYDVDKMNVYLPNYTIENGVPKYIKYTEGSTDLAAIDNRLNELMKDFVMSPDNFAQLVDPIDAEWMKELANKINPETKNSEGFAALADRNFVMDVTERNLVAKALVGIMALQSTNNVFAQLYDLKISSSVNIPYKNQLKPISTRIDLEGAIQDETGVSLSAVKTADGRLVSQTISQLINAAVDAAKDPYIVRLGIRESTAGVFTYLLRAGVSVETASMFLNQPIIKSYLENQGRFESHLSEVAGFKAYKDELVEMTKKEYPNKGKFTETISNAMLKNMLTGKVNNAVQHKILDDFIRYQEIGKKISEAINATTYDTKASKNTSEIHFKLHTTKSVITNQEIINYSKLFENNGFLEAAYKANQEFMKMMSPLFLSMKNKDFMIQFQNLVNLLAHPLNRKSLDDKVNVLNKLKRDYTTYVIQNNEYTLNGIKQAPLSTETNRLMVGENSVANRLGKVKSAYPQNALLAVLSSNFNADFHTVSANLSSSKYDLNDMTKDWDMLFNDPKTAPFAQDLIKLILIQSGHQASPINFVSLVPVKYMAEMINTASKNHASQDKEESFLLRFFLNNAEDEVLVPRLRSLSRIDKVNYIYPIVAIREVNSEHNKINSIADKQKRDAARKELRQKGIPYYTGNLSIFVNPGYNGKLDFSAYATAKTTVFTSDETPTLVTQLKQRGIKSFGANKSVFQYGKNAVLGKGVEGTVEKAQKPSPTVTVKDSIKSSVMKYKSLSKDIQEKLMAQLGPTAGEIFDSSSKEVQDQMLKCL